MTDAAKMTPPATSAAPTVSTPTSNMSMNVVASSNAPAPTLITPTSNMTITTTSTMTHPHPVPTPQTLTHPTVPPSPIPQVHDAIWKPHTTQSHCANTMHFVNTQAPGIKNSDMGNLVQVIQQAPLHTPTYFQQLCNPQQQLLMSGNITLQPTAMSPSIQAFSAPMLGLPLLSKTGLEPKAGATMKPILMPSTTVSAASLSTPAARAGPILAPSSIMTTNRQITPQMLAASKSILQAGQSNYIPSTTNQTLLIGQLGVLSSQPSLIPAHAKPGEAQKVKPFAVMGQAATLQPKSPILPHPQAGSASGATATTATVLNTSQFKQMQQGTAAQLVSTPQLITSQAAMIASQAQIINPLQALGSIHQGIQWPSGMQPPALLATTQNPIFIRGQQQDMFLQSPPPQAPPAIQPAPTGIQLPKPKQMRPASSVATQTSVSTSLVQTPQASGVRPQVKHRTKAQMNRASLAPGTILNQKADAANQTKIPIAPPQQSTASQTKSQSEVKQLPIQKAHRTRLLNLVSPSATANVETQVSSPIPLKPQAIAVPNKPEEEPMDTSISESCMDKEPEMNSFPTSTKDDEPKLHINGHPTMEVQPSVACSVSTSTTTTAVMSTVTTAMVSAPIMNSIDSTKEKQPQKAIVKPQVLTHIIDGYVIQEGPEPFPVNRASLMTEFIPPKPPQTEKEPEEMEEPPKKKDKTDTELAKCEFCGKVDAKRKFKRSKRFCSTSCAKRYNVGCSKPADIIITTKSKKHGMKSRKGWRKSPSSRPPAVNTEDWQAEESSPKEETSDSHSGAESSLSPTTPTSQKDMEIDNPEPEQEPQPVPEPAVSKDPLKWTVQNVFEFIKALPGCSDYADEFRLQEIDGQALLLLKEDHLMTTMNMKLGPALKICARINSLRDEVGRQ